MNELRTLQNYNTQLKQKVPIHILKELFEKQYNFIVDPARKKAALCSRRAGKTYAAAIYLVYNCLRFTNCLCAYVATSRTSAKRILWQELLNLNAKHNLNITFNHTDLIAVFPNKSRIWLSGASDSSEIEKFRGSKYKLVIVDEAASFGSFIEQMIDEVFEPALIDEFGTLALIGTPSAGCQGKFFEATTGVEPNWSVHKWTITQNPHIPHAQQYIADLKKQRNWEDDNPVYLREWTGVWIRDDDSLVYKYNAEKCDWDGIVPNTCMYVLGVDFGYNDASAFVVGAFTPKKPYFYVVETYKKSEMIPTEIANKIRQLQQQYQPFKTVGDSGGLGKSLIEEFRQRHSLVIEAAEKKNKWEYIELMNDDFRGGYIKVTPNSDIVDEWSLLQYDADSVKLKEDDRFENHLADACLYAWRESRHYTFAPEPEKPKYGTEAYWQEQENMLIKQAEEEIEREREFQDESNY